jgi:cold shock protein
LGVGQERIGHSVLKIGTCSRAEELGPPWMSHAFVAHFLPGQSDGCDASLLCRGVFFGRTAMPTGTVKWFDSKKGFGFILSPEGKDVFVHFSSIVGDGFRALKDGEQVEYEQMQGEKGLLAKNVKRMEAATKIKN